MQTRVVLPTAVVVLGLAAFVLGYVAAEKSKGFLSSEDYDGQQHCVYRRNPGLGCGVAGALLVLMGVILATVGSAHGPATGRGRAVATWRLEAAWVAALMATVLFLDGATMKQGRSSSCTELRSNCFYAASIVSAIATGFAIAAYVSSQRTDEPAPGVEMGQPQPAVGAAVSSPPVANPAPPQYGHGGDDTSQPAGTA